MVRRCHELDPTRVVSAAVNGDNRRGVTDAFDIVGFNYGLERPDKYHADFPKRPIYGSETSSAISTRGIYVTDPAAELGELVHRRGAVGRNARGVVDVLRNP